MRFLPAVWSRIAEHESWRKERHRPATYVHKWWARRLGSVFRHLLTAAAGPDRARSPRPDTLAGMVVYDPFAGSGTTLVEAAKLGARVIGRDINPVATLTQRQALAPWDLDELERLFEQVERACRADLDALHVAVDGAPVLHYFWVAVTACPTCAVEVELFSNYVFAKHAYPSRFPRAQATCPTCHAVCPIDLCTDTAGHCAGCKRDFGFAGPVQVGGNAGRYLVCENGHRSRVLDALCGIPPTRRMYAKVVRIPAGREYRPIDEFDLALYDRAGKLFVDAGPGELVLPDGTIEDGANTVQALRWGYRTWAGFFNDRQAYALGRIGAAIRDLPGHGSGREALAAAFGKTLEHHNLFCSFKGEGTGPVRSIFHNHVLRPERCSVEGNPWGSAGGSGGFADALSRLTAAGQYKADPVDLIERDGRVVNVTGQSTPIGHRIVGTWADFAADPNAAYVTTGDGGTTDLPDGSVSLVVTDPPYIDNVHYSELADFFHAWMRPIGPHAGYPSRESTRDQAEVQNASADAFRTMAARVWTECARVMVDDGLLVFSFHQSRTAGWTALMASLSDAALVVTAVRPTVAEVTTSLTKVAAAAPNRVDVIVVCRKRSQVTVVARTPAQARADAVRQLAALRIGGLALGTADVVSTVRAGVLAQGTREVSPDWIELAAKADRAASDALRSWGRG
ncbi:DNA methyltransferase [Nocardioides speluncae]|uniref:DNA methyltransferase n=1 Tax=Nocardioides speluncae TaxID=2670337 RepID=UPI0012B17B1A|nr:DNA methyltransferase [Nocardioides speluncae]